MNDWSAAFAAPPDAETQWREFERTVRDEQRSFFDGSGTIFAARAPGRLDIMGGFADYSGSLVLELPLSEATFAAWQWRDDHLLRLRSLGPEAAGLDTDVTVPLDVMVDEAGSVRTPDEIRQRLPARDSARVPHRLLLGDAAGPQPPDARQSRPADRRGRRQYPPA
jgi:L-arabinokinase